MAYTTSNLAKKDARAHSVLCIYTQVAGFSLSTQNNGTYFIYNTLHVKFERSI